LKPILVDTNVLISALVFGGKPRQVLQLADVLGIPLVISEHLESELSVTLRKKFGWGERRIAEARTRLFRDARLVDFQPIEGIVRDRDDHHVLAAAVAGGAQVIVTGDRDLLCLAAFRGIPIVTPAEFLRRLGMA
jgi:putative PIN family toxin of toxin-antitoxin system